MKLKPNKKIFTRGAAAALIVVGLLCFFNILDVAGMAGTAMAVVEFYSTFEPNIVSWNFPGTSENPTTIKAGEFKPEVTVKMDEDTEVDMQASTGQVDGSGNWAVYWDYSRDPGKVWIGNVVTAVGQTHHIKINIVFKRSNGTTYTRTAEGYVTGGDVKGRWYLDQYDLSALGTYEVLKIPLTGSVTLKFAATEGASYVDSAYFKIWRHQTGIPVEDYENYVPTPDWTVTLNKVSDDTWTNTWTPEAGTFVMYGYVKVGTGNYRQLTVIPTFGGGWFSINQIIGIICIATGAFLVAKK